MAKVGSKGQIVIDKKLRDKLGIEPGWYAIQRLVDDHIEIYFVPGPHNRSLYGALAPYTKVRMGDMPWHEVEEEAYRIGAEQERARWVAESDEEYDSSPESGQ